MPKPIGDKSKRQQLAEIYRRRYGSNIEAPTVKYQKIWEAHKATNDLSYKNIEEFVGMYAGYFIFSEPDPHTNQISYVATRLRHKIHRINWNEQIIVIANRTHWVFGSSKTNIVEAIISRMVDNSGYRGGGTAKITRTQLPKSLRQYL